MSRVYFHTRHEGTAELYGSERACTGVMIDDLFCTLLNTHDYPSRPSPLRRWFPPDHYIHGPSRMPWDQHIRLALRSYTEEAVLHLPDGRTVNTWQVALNTAVIAGSDQVRFLARMHAACEIHAWLDGADRAWLADLIDQGRSSGIYRPGMGWEQVAALLRRSADGRVFTSYSVCDAFPNQDAAKYLPPTWRGPAGWYDLPEAEIKAWVNAHSTPARERYADDPTMLDYYRRQGEEATWDRPSKGLEELIPNEDAYPDQEGEGGWWTLSEDEQWELAEAQTIQNQGLHLTPDNLAVPWFGDGTSAFQLNELIAQEQSRMRAAP